jgi:hypothetical protein
MHLESSFTINELLDGDGKLSYSLNTAEDFVLPSFKYLIDKLGLPSNFLSVVKLAVLNGAEAPDLSKTTLRNIDKGGIGKKSGEKLISWLDEVSDINIHEKITELNKNQTFRDLELIKSPTADWYCLMAGIQDLLPSNGFLPPSFEVINMIKRRITFNSDSIESIKKQYGVQDLESLKKSFPDESQFRKEIVKILSSRLNDLPLCALYEEESITLHALKYDFYLELIASIQFSIDSVLKSLGAPSSNTFSQILLQQAIQEYTHDKDVKNCFSGLLQALRKLLSSEDKKAGWKKLSSYIPIEEQEGSTTSIEDKQYTEMKHWRNGQDKGRPSIEKFKKFSKALFKDLNRKDDEILVAVFYLIRMLDKLRLEMINDRRFEGNTDVNIRSVLSRYPQYYERLSNQRIENRV